MSYRFTVSPHLCTGCRTCELACSFMHAVEGKRGATRIHPLETGFKELWVPVVCLQCDDAACVKSCLVDALKRNPETGTIDLDREVCVRCMACVAACPFGCSLLDDQHNLVVKCDLCGGDPACAHFCPTHALEWKPIETVKRKQAV
ncbi:MAG: 4Fe-4S dicluster domain-containing protein [Candidatus Zixiibacteriota bacterium]|nr:MAG: 4Fe-4S dicluster domain-containing protein [candidate division Zixibacteria bacterium]